MYTCRALTRLDRSLLSWPKGKAQKKGEGIRCKVCYFLSAGNLAERATADANVASRHC
jgi:hypothetical protein